jgi:predicted glycosyltransferase
MSAGYAEREPPIRLMTYSQDGLGLGHMRRMNSIAARFTQVRPNAALLRLSDSPVPDWFDPPAHHDFIKLPSIVKLGPGDWRPLTLPVGLDDMRTIRSELIRSAALWFRPDILLVDHIPHGAMGELVPAFEALRAAGAATKIVLGLRDIIDHPEVVKRRWRIEGAYEAIRLYYDRVLVYGDPGLFDFVKAYALPRQVAARVRYCGYVCTSDQARYPRRVRVDGPGWESTAKLLVAMAGGGADAFPLMCAVIDSMSGLSPERRPNAVLVVGPFMPRSQRRELQARAVGLPVRVRMAVSDPISYIEAADVIVAMAGYNTVLEIVRSDTPAILVPRAGPSAEQSIRARLFASQGWVDALDGRDLSPAALGEAIQGVLERGQPHRTKRPPLDGAERAVDLRLQLLDPTPDARVPLPGE